MQLCVVYSTIANPLYGGIIPFSINTPLKHSQTFQQQYHTHENDHRAKHKHVFNAFGYRVLLVPDSLFQFRQLFQCFPIALIDGIHAFLTC